MIYKYGINSEKALYMNIDSAEIFKKLSLMYKIKEYEQLKEKLKKIIKKPNDMATLCAHVKLDINECLQILCGAFPELFNKRMINSLRRIYGNPVIEKKEERKKRKYVRRKTKENKKKTK